MRPANFTPIDSEFVAKLVRGLSLGNKGDLLSEVKGSIFHTIDALDFNQIDFVVLIGETALKAKNGAIDMKLRGSW